MLLNCGVGEDSWEFLGLQGDQTSPPKGNQSWIFTGRTVAEVEAPVLWPPETKNWLTGKDPGVGKDWGQEERRTKGDEMVGWHHWFSLHGFKWTPQVGDVQWSLACCSPWGHKELDTTERLNWIVLDWTVVVFAVEKLRVLHINLAENLTEDPQEIFPWEIRLNSYDRNEHWWVTNTHFMGWIFSSKYIWISHPSTPVYDCTWE